MRTVSSIKFQKKCLTLCMQYLIIINVIYIVLDCAHEETCSQHLRLECDMNNKGQNHADE